MKGPRPAEEAERLGVLSLYRIAGTARDPLLDDLARLAAQVCGTPIALISIVEDQRVWFKAKVGWDPDEAPRTGTFCERAILDREVTVVSDAREDPRFAASPFVTAPPHIRFYAGAPLLAEGGHALGTLCVLDYEQRRLDEGQRQALTALARQVMAQIELRRRAGELATAAGQSARAVEELRDLGERLEIETRRRTVELLTTVERSLEGLIDGAAEHAWRRDRESVLRVLDALGQGVTVVDEFGNLEYVNPAYARLTGLRPAQLVGRSPIDFVPPEDRHLLEKAQAERRAGHTTSCEHRVVRQDGSVARVLMTGAPRWNGDRVVGSFGVVADLTAHRRTEEALRRAADGVSAKTGEAFFHSLVEHLARATEADFAFVGEIVGPNRDRIRAIAVWAHQGIADNIEYGLAGTPCENIVGRQLCLYPANVQREFPEDVLLAEMGVEAYCGVPLFHPSGDAVGLLAVMHGSPFSDDDLAVTTLRIFAARAAAELERRRMEGQLLQLRKLESLGRLAGGVAHDFNNVTTTILGAAEVMAERLPFGDPSHEELQQIRTAAERAGSLTLQLLAFARRQVIRPRVVDLNALVREIERMLRRVIGEPVELRTELASDLWPVRVDPGQIEQVLLNLAVNARDAMPNGGRLTIRTENRTTHGPRRRAGDPDHDDWVSVSVRDTGVGMSDELRHHIFEPFYTTKEVGRGTGLGLATCDGIIAQSGGRIEVETAAGRGSTFWIHLPRAQPEASAQQSSTRPAVRLEGDETILLVEDEAAVRSLLAKALRSRGYHVLEAEDGPRALELSREYDGVIHLLVTDAVMPRMSGSEVGTVLRGERPDVRMLIISGYAGDDMLDRALEALEATVLQKPFRPTEFVRKVREILER